ncbi:hypothetical protein FEM48_Zijuj06G0136600 [Ziziphus jujuba var. spinosa]|uniref:Uncharacterized protein n=1 Tax=Ziziphus jujuba var. spinosa TaxID=714518 RepID=A0A978V9L5_ZIZJJ|nr:hypothetical protein FEM48_Zijuj06G0136600 [Ziziphus jujuba var. spinosa]
MVVVDLMVGLKHGGYQGDSHSACKSHNGDDRGGRFVLKLRSPFLFCGAITVSHPSVILTLPSSPPCRPTIRQDRGEELVALPSLDVVIEKRTERLAMKAKSDPSYEG